MGISLSWLAVRGKSAEAVRNELELRSTGKFGQARGSLFAAAASNAGWYLVIAHRCQHRIISGRVVKGLSSGCEVLTCTVEEHVMFSEATGWRNGERLWSVTHRGDDERTRKTVNEAGTLPSEYFAIRDRLFQKQGAEDTAVREVDFLFEIPVMLGQILTGYKHDEPSPAFEAHSFELLESARKSFFQRLFSK